MNQPNYHGYQDEEINLAKTKLGKRRFSNFEGARLKKLRGEQIQAQENHNNHPMKAANNRNWSDSTRYMYAQIAIKQYVVVFLNNFKYGIG